MTGQMKETGMEEQQRDKWKCEKCKENVRVAKEKEYMEIILEIRKRIFNDIILCQKCWEKEWNTNLAKGGD